jgi:hypothetical protein
LSSPINPNDKLLPPSIPPRAHSHQRLLVQPRNLALRRFIARPVRLGLRGTG